MADPAFIAAWEHRVRWLGALRVRLEARPRRLDIELQIDAVYRALERLMRQRDAMVSATRAAHAG